MRLGVIGVGRIGVLHAQTVRNHPEVDTVVVADADPQRARKVADELGVETAATVDAVFGDVDAVVIAAATDAHAPLIHQAVDAGLPAFCEKPIALDLPATEAVVAHVRERGTALQIGFQRRFDAGYQRAQALVADGTLGTLYLVRAATHDPAPPHEAYIPASGGIFRDLHIHDLDALRFVTGQEVAEVYADGAVLGHEVFVRHDDVDTAAALLRLSGGTLAILSGARHDPLGYDVRMELFGSGDSVAVGWDDRSPLRSVEPDVAPPPGPAYAHFADRFGHAYRRELDVFVQVALGRTPSPCTAEDAREALRVALACDRSRREHRPVPLEEITT